MVRFAVYICAADSITAPVSSAAYDVATTDEKAARKVFKRTTNTEYQTGPRSTPPPNAVRIAMRRLLRRLSSDFYSETPRGRRREVLGVPMPSGNGGEIHHLIVDDLSRSPEKLKIEFSTQKNVPEKETLIQPSSVMTTMHEHQLEALHWMHTCEEAVEERQKALPRLGGAADPLGSAPQDELLVWKPHRVQRLEWYAPPSQNPSEVLHWANTVYFNEWSAEVLQSLPPAPPPVKGGILADEMGLGKTLEILSLIAKDLDDETEAKTDNPPKKRKRVAPPTARIVRRKTDPVKVEPEVAINVDSDSDMTVIDLISSPERSSPRAAVHNIESEADGDDDDDATVIEESEETDEEEDDEFVSPPTSRTLIVAPVSVLTHWKEEAGKHLNASSFNLFTHYGSQRGNVNALKNASIVVTSYTVVSNEWMQVRKMEERSGTTMGTAVVPKLCPIRFGNEEDAVLEHPGLFGLVWDRVILDEAHFIREPTTKWSQACVALKAKKRWAVSGTPLQNKLTDLWALFRFLRVPVLSNYSVWTALIADPIEREDAPGNEETIECSVDADGLISPAATLKEISCKRLQATLASILLRREKSQIHLAGLPPRENIHTQLDFTATELPFYTTLNKVMLTRFKRLMDTGEVKRKRASVLEMLLRLRQACDHPYLVINGIAGGKNAESHMDGLYKHFIHELQKPDRGDSGVKKELAGLLTKCLRKPQKEATTNGSSESFEFLSGGICHICSEEIDSDDPAILPCTHRFCYPCIHSELTLRGICPDCDTPCNVGEIFRPFGGGARFLDVRTGWKSSSKIKRLLSDLSAMDHEDKAVVFSQFTGMLDVVEQALTESGWEFARLDGSMSMAKRDAAVEALRVRKTCRVFLVSLKAGGVGLNLCVANHCFLLDPWWNPAVESQALDRVHRVGQTKPVRCVRYTVKDSVEERLLTVQQRKLALTGAIFSDFDTSAAKLTDKDLMALFGI